MGNYHARCGAGEKPEVTTLEAYLSLFALPDDFCSLLSTMRSRRISSVIIIQNLAQIKALFKDTWETITGNCDTLVYLGGNEKSTHQYISELLGKSTIDKRSNGETRGVHGSASRNYDVLGRELMTPDEVRNMSNKKCLIFIKGFDPIFDDKFRPLGHENFSQTMDGGAKPYKHNPKLTNVSFVDTKLLSEDQINEVINGKKQDEVLQIMELSLQELLILDDDTELYFPESTAVKVTSKDETTNDVAESEEEDGAEPKLTRAQVLEMLPEEELKEDIMNRLFSMDFTEQQMLEAYVAMDAHIKLSILLTYLYPTTPAEEMVKKREQYKNTQ